MKGGRNCKDWAIAPQGHGTRAMVRRPAAFCTTVRSDGEAAVLGQETGRDWSLFVPCRGFVLFLSRLCVFRTGPYLVPLVASFSRISLVIPLPALLYPFLLSLSLPLDVSRSLNVIPPARIFFSVGVSYSPAISSSSLPHLYPLFFYIFSPILYPIS